MDLKQVKTVEQLAALMKTMDMVTSVPWTDYSDTSTIVGFSAYSVKLIRYRKVGKLVFVVFSIHGTSDLVTTTFTLPFSNTTNPPINLVIHAEDDSVWSWGRINVLASSATVSCYYGTGSGNTWTASGTKAVRGEFFFETA